MKKIFKIVLKHEMDENPDTSFLGEYTDKLENGVIVRLENEFLEKLPKDYELPESRKELRFFKPYAGGEKVGTKEYYKYGRQDYKRMEELESGWWHFIGVRAYAEVGVSLDGGKSWKLDELTSGGLWGVESDSDKAHIKEIEEDELDNLKAYLKQYGFTAKQIKEAFENVERED